MSRGRHSEAAMIAALKQVEAGRAVEDVAREIGVSKHTIYGWKAKYGGMDVSQAQEARQLRERRGRRSTTKKGRTAVWGTGHPGGLLPR